MIENRFDILADSIYQDFKDREDFETSVVKYLHLITKLLVFYLSGELFRGSHKGE